MTTVEKTIKTKVGLLRLLKNRVNAAIEEAVTAMGTDQPTYGQLRVSNELKKRSIFVSPGGVRSIWQRHNLETFQKRLKALEEKAVAENLVLTGSQLHALEKTRVEKEPQGEIETEYPGYLGTQDTYYVGTLKGVGCIYQQTFIDTYTNVAFAKLYDRKNALVAADMLNDRVVPFFEEEGVRLLRVLTDRGTEFCGSLEHHEYELYLAIEDIHHSKTKARHPQTNGICEHFHYTIQEKFYQVAFRKKIYHSIEELQADLDKWLWLYNLEWTQTGNYCFGRTPYQLFQETKYLTKEKMLDTRFSLPGSELQQNQTLKSFSG